MAFDSNKKYIGIYQLANTILGYEAVYEACYPYRKNTSFRDKKFLTATHRQAFDRVEVLYGLIAEKLTDLDFFFELTPENAKQLLLDKGWIIEDHINFDNFTPGSWLDHLVEPYKRNTSAGVNNKMNFNNKTISQYDWSSD